MHYFFNSSVLLNERYVLIDVGKFDTVFKYLILLLPLHVFPCFLRIKQSRKRRSPKRYTSEKKLKRRAELALPLLHFSYFELFEKLIFFANSTFVEFCLALVVCKKGTARSICATL